VRDMSYYAALVRTLSDADLEGELRHLLPECGPVPRGANRMAACVRETMRERGMDFDALLEAYRRRRNEWHRVNGPAQVG
jgi:hypothetical protein